MRKELKIIGSRERHVFTATFIRFGFRDGYKGPVKTILLQDVLLDGKIVTDHLWFDLTKGFESADLLPGDVVEFCARVSIYEKGYKGYRNDVFDRPIEKDYRLSRPTLESINSFNDTVKKANEIKDRVLKYVYNIKQERSYNNDLVGIFERYKDIADGDMEVAMNFIKEAYPFNEETESFIRKKFDMPIPDESKEQ